MRVCAACAFGCSPAPAALRCPCASTCLLRRGATLRAVLPACVESGSACLRGFMRSSRTVHRQVFAWGLSVPRGAPQTGQREGRSPAENARGMRWASSRRCLRPTAYTCEHTRRRTCRSWAAAARAGPCVQVLCSSAWRVVGTGEKVWKAKTQAGFVCAGPLLKLPFLFKRGGEAC